MIEVQIDKVCRYLPSSWDELSAKQLFHVCSLYNKNITKHHFQISVLSFFLNVRTKLWNSISPDDIFTLSQILEFLFEDVTLTKATVTRISSKRFPWTRYYGPADNMELCTFGEYTKAQVRFEKFNATKDPHALDELCAILFRRKKMFWFIRGHFLDSSDKREKFLDRTLKARTAEFAKIDPAIKMAVLLFFSGVSATLPVAFPNVFRSKKESGKKADGSWSTLILSLADGKTDDQSLDRIMNSNLYNVFMGLEQKSIEYFEFLSNNPTP